ncbi:carboxylesterase [Acidocella sp.]|uniref:alpha/beta hydrolase n=1 Tax=Acidocella sp. TaxID=50710 RepID=UPI00260B86C2|nr:alpha/beta hydrolase [Acidocella sp.]MDD2795031.1 alpha/beta hydrolase [Acidocella sp.]
MAVTFRAPDMALAYEFLEGAGPVVVFCPGFASDMGGTKAMALWEMCRTRGQAMLRFDYGGHGQSAGAFEDGCIGDWAADAAHVVEVATAGRELLLVGSSMGGWIALLLARAQAGVRAMVLVAPAPDFTELLMKPQLGEAQWAELRRAGVIYQPSEYGAPTPLTLKLLEDGARNLVLEAPIGFSGPVRVLHGMRDADVPWRHSLLLAERLASEDVRLVFVKDGDHRLSRTADLALLCETVGAFLGEGGG